MSAEGFLGVERSAAGKRWRARLDDDRMALALAQRLSLPEIVARVLTARGIDADTAPAFLAPRLRDMLPDPGHLKDMDAASKRIVHAIEAGETIAIFGDYDVDGATSSAVLQRFLTAAGGKVRIYIPDRIREGYGPNAPALLRLKSEGVALVITVDCGVTAHAPLAEAAEAGLDVIVVDHHVAEPKLPRACAVINPNRLDETSPHRQLAAVGVSFLLAVAVNRRLREGGWYAAREAPDLLNLLDLVALGTVCDVVPMTGLNRALVTQGLKIMAGRCNLGLAALADVAHIQQRCDAYHLGFVLGPRVNAGGRVGEADLGARLLTSEDPEETRRLAERLDRHNRERQQIEGVVLEAAIAQVEADGKSAMAFAAGEGWHPGVIGVAAGRLRERYEKPAIVVALAGGIGKASCRSAQGVDIGAAVIAARQAGLLINGGGHPNAAGFTVEQGKLAELKSFLEERVAAEAATAAGPSLGFDGALSLSAATAELVETLQQVGPYGVGNPEPRFVFPSVRVAKADIVGERHVRCFLSDPRGARLNAIAFRAVDTPIGGLLMDRAGASLHLAGRLRADEWRGAVRVQLQIEDAAPALNG